ncbi:MAG: LysR family transcriptional regulator [Zoogloeaceae bacterium]|nr:LysR family transcriptional regulator [Rhodocyclaceae bacterium]MCP5237562.1 LysR family transcriptional regulator [Zoogloeaceae bacterium]
MDKLRLMESFVTIVDAGSLTAAAHRRQCSLAAVVRGLAQLEAYLGVRLLNRTTRRIALTEEGRSYLVRCRRVLADIGDAEAVVGDRGRPGGTLVLTAPVMFGRLHVAPVVVDLLARHPSMRVELLLLDRVVDLLEEGIDLAVRIGALQDSSMIALPLGDVRAVVCASPGYVARHGAPGTPDSLLQHRCIRMLGNPATVAWRFEHDGRRQTLEVGGVIATNQLDVAVDACIRGLGVGRFLSYQVADALADGRLVEVLADARTPPVPVHFVYPHSRLLSSRVRAFVDLGRPVLAQRLSAVGRRVAGDGVDKRGEQ